MSKPPVLKEIVDCLHGWNRSANITRALYGLLTALSIFCTVIVGGSSASSAATSGSTSSTSQFGFLQAWQVAALSITAAISVGTMSALDIRGNADRIRRAWRKLNVAVMKYRTEPNYAAQPIK